MYRNILDKFNIAAGVLGFAGLLSLYEARIAAFTAAPPPPDWDGVFEADRK